MIDYEEDWILTLLFRKDGSVAIRASMFAIPAATVAVLLIYMDEWAPGQRESLGMLEVSGSQIWNASTAVLAILLGFRTGQAFRRFWEGTGLLHQMRGEWFDTVSNCVTFSIGAKPEKPKEVGEFRNTLVRLMSLCHGSALEEIAGNQIKLEAIDVFGLDDGTLNHLKECHEVHGFNKVEVMLHLVQSLITTAHSDGVLKIPPPILSRVYQTISRGFVNLLNAKKITDTRFPFPYAQLISFLLIIHVFLTPMIISGVIKSKVLAAIFAFVPIFGMFSLNFIASELENPFGTDDNDLPLEHFQTEMNSCLLMLLHTNTDMIAGTSPRCIMNFEQLLGSMHSHHGSNERMNRLSAFESDGKDAAPEPPPEEKAPLTVAPPPAAPPEPVKEAQKKEEKTPLLAATPEAQMACIQPRLSKSMQEFTGNLQCWANTLESNVNQMRRLFDELKVLSDHLPALLSKQRGAGWESAVCAP